MTTEEIKNRLHESIENIDDENFLEAIRIIIEVKHKSLLAMSISERVNRIVWSKNALRDIKEIFEYWNRTNDNKDYSRKLNKEFSSLVDLLMLFPRIGRTVENYDIRFLCKYVYIIFYKTKGSIKKPDIEIIQVWDSRRDPLELKL